MAENDAADANGVRRKAACALAFQPAGTVAANYTSCERHGGWGGARNYAERISEGLSDRQAAGLVNAAEFASEQGLTFQRHLIIHYGMAGIAANDGAGFVSRYLSLVRKQARREGRNMAALWVRECASDKGEHVHILLSLPNAMRLHGKTRRWLKAAGGQWAKGVVCVRIIGGRLPREKADDRHRMNVANVLRYVLKGASADMGAELGLTRACAGGPIVGKRCGWSQCIGARARQAAGWKS